ncbi:hypothetical protein OF830_28200 [Bacillus paramycoides]|nr:hypothetical protein [Bacillus paramycoides]
MSISVSDELQLFAQEIQSFLSPNTLRDLARDVGFVQRASKYPAKDLNSASTMSPIKSPKIPLPFSTFFTPSTPSNTLKSEYTKGCSCGNTGCIRRYNKCACK